MERPLLYSQVTIRFNKTIGPRETEVSTKDTPYYFIESVEHSETWPGPRPLPGGAFNKSNLRPTKGSQEMAAPRKGESVRGLVSDRIFYKRHGKGGGADRT